MEVALWGRSKCKGNYVACKYSQVKGEIGKGPPSSTGQLSLAEVELAPDLVTGPGLRLVSGRGRTRTPVSGTPLPVIRRQRGTKSRPEETTLKKGALKESLVGLLPATLTQNVMFL